jgi:hypothetical protein
MEFEELLKRTITHSFLYGWENVSISQKEYALDCQVLKLLCDGGINDQEYKMLKTSIKNYRKTLNEVI